MAKGIDNRGPNLRIEALLDRQIKEFAEEYRTANVREIPNIETYRNAFSTLGINPNKYMCSIEALSKRVQKNAILPHINAIVDLGNALSLKYLLSLGAHDISALDSDLEVRFSEEQDRFLGMGESEPEIMPADELIYASGHIVKTRRWIWRQSDDGKITERTSRVFFPIDGFEDVNRTQILQARDELAAILQEEFRCQVKTGYVNKTEPVFTWDLE